MKKPVIMAAAAALVVLALVYFLVLPKMKGSAAPAVDDEDAAVTQVAKKKAKKAPEPGLIYPLPERVLNLDSPAGQPHFARFELALEFEQATSEAKKPAAKGEAKPGATPALDPALEPVAIRQAQIDDMIVRIIGSKTYEQMTSPDGKETLKQEILAGVEQIVPTPAIIGVYIRRMVVQ